MAHSYVVNHYHCVFSTKERRKLITPDLQQRLCPFLAALPRQHDMKALVMGGIEDHVHLLLSLPSTLAIAKAIQVIKGESSNGSTTPSRSLTIFHGKKATERLPLALHRKM